MLARILPLSLLMALVVVSLPAAALPCGEDDQNTIEETLRPLCVVEAMGGGYCGSSCWPIWDLLDWLWDQGDPVTDPASEVIDNYGCIIVHGNPICASEVLTEGAPRCLTLGDRPPVCRPPVGLPPIIRP